MMSGTLVLLGFTSCDENSTGTGRCEYGTPYAKYEIKGKVMGEDRQIRFIRKRTESISIRIL